MSDDIATRLGDRLRDAGGTVATAESCTGGLVGGRITAVPGASDYYLGTVVAYDNDLKRRLLGVTRESLDQRGAVSAAVARELARGVRDRTDATWGVSTTGVAGPSGGTEETPVGTVYIGVAYAGEWGTESSYATATRHEFDGDRAAVREATVDRALGDLLAELDG
ncbi:CinA family protein [Halostella salina]|uniref:CinA family protein n=1 Tax=Halostella salina TaxID=1547897 RepID=UPI000EF840B3|nr:CinA family protein [Halostella salina]